MKQSNSCYINLVFVAILSIALFAKGAEKASNLKINLIEESVDVLPINLEDSKWGLMKNKENAGNRELKYADVFVKLLRRGGAKARLIPNIEKIKIPRGNENSDEKLDEIIKESGTNSKYIVFVEIESNAELEELTIVIFENKVGKIFSKTESNFAIGRPRNPLAALVYATGMLGNISDLKDPMARDVVPEDRK